VIARGTSATSAGFALLAVVFCSCSGTADQGPEVRQSAAAMAPAPSLASLATADLDAFIARTVRETHAIGVNVGVMRGGEVIFAKSQERGGMEVSSLKLKLGATAASTVLYRTPDGKIQEFLFNRR